MCGFETCFADEFAVSGKGKSRFRYLPLAPVWASVPFTETGITQREVGEFRAEMTSPTFKHMALQPVLKSCPRWGGSAGHPSAGCPWR